MSFKQFVCQECSESCYCLVPNVQVQPKKCLGINFDANWEELKGREMVSIVPITEFHTDLDEEKIKATDEVFGQMGAENPPMEG